MEGKLLKLSPTYDEGDDAFDALYYDL